LLWRGAVLLDLLMPMMPPMHRPAGARTKQERGREHDVRRQRSQPWRAFYRTREWREIRARQRAAQPLCERCLKAGKTVPMAVVNHVERHRGDWAKFIAGPFESLCKPCHDGEVQREERAADAAVRR
jgi:5-methylcytosine-specific restriction enzyme A